MKNLSLITSPLLSHKLGCLRDKNTSSAEFRALLKDISSILVYEAMKNWNHLEKVKVSTPIADAEVEKIMNPPVIVSVLRAGNGMLDAALSMLPFASTGFIGIYRDKHIHNIVEYYYKMPEHIAGKEIFLCDPLIASADTVVAAIDRLKESNVGKITVLSILASRTGIQKINKFHPDVDIFTINIEEKMNDAGYLVPGLGDAGDRLYQTK